MRAAPTSRRAFVCLYGCRILERHLELYLRAVAAAAQDSASTELQRECRALQEQLASLFATAAREAPDVLLAFGAASLVHSGSTTSGCSTNNTNSHSSISLFLSAIDQCLSAASATSDGTTANRETTTQHALLQLLHQHQQQLHVLLYGSLQPARGSSAVTSRAPQGSLPSQEIACTTWRCMLLFLLQSCCPGGCPAVATSASQAWGHLAGAFICKSGRPVDAEQQQAQQEQQQLALLPPDLQQVQELLWDFTQQNAALEIRLRQRRSPRGPSQPLQPSEEVQLLRHQQHQRAQSVNQQQAGQQLSLLLPLSSLFRVTATLLASLRADDPQQLKASLDIYVIVPDLSVLAATDVVNCCYLKSPP